MINKKQQALIRKELRGVVLESGFFLNYLLLPLIMSLVIPVGAVLAVSLADVTATISELEFMLTGLGIYLPPGLEEMTIIGLIINNLIPTFFLMIPTIVVTVVAASSFTGEKERRTLETLLYVPLSLKEIFLAKVLTALILGLFITYVSFLIMVASVTTLVWVLLGELFIFGLTWLVILGLVAPALAFLGIVIQVAISAKAKSSEDAYQRGSVLVMPLILLLVSQVAGIILINAWLFALLGLILFLIAYVMIGRVVKNFTYEKLLK